MAVGTADGATSIRVVLVDDEEMIKVGFRAVINAEPDLIVVGEAGDGAAAIGLATELRPDVMLMDVRMPVLDGIEATRRIMAGPDGPPKIIVVTTFLNDDYVYDALRVGASGFLLKRARPAEVIHAIRTVLAGDSLLFPDKIRELAARSNPGRLTGTGLDWARLTPREAEVLRWVTTGMDNDEIAARLVLSTETIKTHVGNLYAKLKVKNRVQAVSVAYDSGFVEPRAHQTDPTTNPSTNREAH